MGIRQGPGAKTNWGRSIPKILPPINGRLIRLHGFTPAEILLEFMPEWKITRTYRDLLEAVPGVMEEALQEEMSM